MAENETLDLGHRNSGRWRRLLQRFRDGEHVDDIVRDATRCLTQSSKGLVKRLPLPELLEAVSRGPREVQAVVRKCAKWRHYAQLFEHSSHLTTNPQAVVAFVLRATLDEFLDQFGHELIGSQRYPTALSFRVFCDEIRSRTREDIVRLSQRICSDPQQPPRMPARSPQEKDREQQRLYSLSLRQTGTRNAR